MGKIYFSPIVIWAKINNISEITIYTRLRDGMSIKDALFRKPSHKKSSNKIEYISFNPYIADEFSEFNKYNEFVKKGLINPKNNDPSKYISISNINFNK